MIYPGRQHQAPGRRGTSRRRRLQGVLVQPGRPAGIGQSFDGNGAFAKFLVGNSGQTLRSQPTSILGTNLKGLQLLARSPLTPLGTRPAFPAEEPPYKPLVPCYTQALPEFNGPLSKGPADGSERMTPDRTATKAG